jgi:hypothetical protein
MQVANPCHQEPPSSHEVGWTYRVYMSTELATLLVLRSLYGLGKKLTYEVFAPLASPGEVTFTEGILSWPFAPLQSVVAPTLSSTGLTPPTTTSHAVSSPSTSSQYRAATNPGGYQPPGTCPHSVSHALRALLHPVPAGRVSCRYRPWGLPFRAEIHPQSCTPSQTPMPSCGWPTTLPAAPAKRTP